jgi:hypothetical protein
MNATKKPPADADRAIADLTSRLRELSARRDVITETIIPAEGTIGSAQFNVAATSAQAEAMLKGEKFVAPREKPVSLLAALYAERGVIDHALKIGNARLHGLTTERSDEIWANHFPEIATIEKRRVFLVFELQCANRAREKLRAKINKAGGSGYLPTDGVEFLGLGDEFAEVEWAANRLIADGIATRSEIERARSDG